MSDRYKEYMDCSNCNKQISVGINFCPFCGNNCKIAPKGWMTEDAAQNTIRPNTEFVTNIPTAEHIHDLNMDENLLDAYDTVSAKLNTLHDAENMYNNQKQFSDAVKGQYEVAKKHYKELKKIAKKEKEDVEELTKLTWKSIKTSFKGDKDELLAKERAEYLDAKNNKEKAKVEYKDLKAKKEYTSKQLIGLKSLLDQKQLLEDALGTILDKICGGVPDPIEDEIEAELAKYMKIKNNIEGRVNNLTNAKNFLVNGYGLLEKGLKSLSSAKSYSTWDTFLGGGMIVDAIKHSKMSNSRDILQNAKREISMAFKYVPEIPLIRNANVAQGNFVWDVMFDNIFSDLRARRQIQESLAQMQDTLDDVDKAVDWVEGQLNAIDKNHKNLDNRLRETKRRLNEERKRMVEERITT